MLTPRYFFSNDFSQCYEYFLSKPHKKKNFSKGEYLWKPGEPFRTIHYIISGIIQCYIIHENGHRKIVSFHGKGTVFPGYHQKNYKIESSIITVAMTDIEVIEFTKEEFHVMFENNTNVRSAVIDWFSTYTNLLLYDSAHQEYNNAFIKLCNLLYLLFAGNADIKESFIGITQDELADILGTSRVNLARGLSFLRTRNIIATHRKQIEIIDISGLISYCSFETL